MLGSAMTTYVTAKYSVHMEDIL